MNIMKINKFSNKVVVITGSFKKYSRKEITQKLISLGANSFF